VLRAREARAEPTTEAARRRERSNCRLRLGRSPAGLGRPSVALPERRTKRLPLLVLLAEERQWRCGEMVVELQLRAGRRGSRRVLCAPTVGQGARAPNNSLLHRIPSSPARPTSLQASRPTCPPLIMLPSRVFRALPPTIAQTLRSPPSPEAEITVRGWVALVQPKKHFSFVKLTDGSSREPLQIFVDGAKGASGLRRCVQDGSLSSRPRSLS